MRNTRFEDASSSLLASVPAAIGTAMAHGPALLTWGAAALATHVASRLWQRWSGHAFLQG